MDKSSYNQYIKKEIKQLESLSISEFEDALRKLKENVAACYLQYLEWDLAAMALADCFIVINEDTRLVNAYEIVDDKYPDIDSFSEIQIEFYKDKIEDTYSHEVIARYCNIVIQCSKQGYKYVDRAIDELQSIYDEADNSKRREYISRILWLAIKYNKTEIIKSVIKELKNTIVSVRNPDKEMIFLPWNLSQYMKAVFIKNTILDEISEIEAIIYHCKKEALNCNYENEEIANRIFEKNLILSRKIKNESLCIDILKDYINYAILVGDAWMKQKDYYKAAASYERAVLLCNKNGLLKRVNEALIKLRKAYVEIGGSIKPTTIQLPIENNKQLENEINQFLTGNASKDFYRFVAFMVGNVYKNSNNLYPTKAESLKKAKKRMNKNRFWEFIGIVKMNSDRKIAETTTEEENEKYLMYEDYIHHIKLITALWFEPVIIKLTEEGLNADIVGYQLQGAEWLSETNRLLINEAIKLFWSENYIAFMHIAIPTYESVFRRLFGYHDLATVHMDMKDGSQKEKVFGEFLKSDMVKNNLPINLIEMSEIIFTDQLGLNLRNNIAHGLCEKEDFDRNTAHIVLQMLILITRFDWIANKESDM